MNNRAFFITFEGGEGSGKSTQAKMLANELKRCIHMNLRGKANLPTSKIRVLMTREPGAGKVGKKLRKILLGTKMPKMCEWLLYEADRAEHAEFIRSAMKKYDVIISDRYHDSTLVYQGYNRGIDRDLIGSVHDRTLEGAMPDLTFFVDVPVKLGLKRARARNVADGVAATQGRFEAEKVSFHNDVRNGFLRQLKINPKRIVRVSGDKGMTKVADSILDTFWRRFDRFHGVAP